MHAAGPVGHAHDAVLAVVLAHRGDPAVGVVDRGEPVVVARVVVHLDGDVVVVAHLLQRAAGVEQPDVLRLGPLQGPLAVAALAQLGVDAGGRGVGAARRPGERAGEAGGPVEHDLVGGDLEPDVRAGGHAPAAAERAGALGAVVVDVRQVGGVAAGADAQVVVAHHDVAVGGVDEQLQAVGELPQLDRVPVLHADARLLDAGGGPDAVRVGARRPGRGGRAADAGGGPGRTGDVGAGSERGVQQGWWGGSGRGRPARGAGRGGCQDDKGGDQCAEAAVWHGEGAHRSPSLGVASPWRGVLHPPYTALYGPRKQHGDAAARARGGNSTATPPRAGVTPPCG